MKKSTYLHMLGALLLPAMAMAAPMKMPLGGMEALRSGLSPEMQAQLEQGVRVQANYLGTRGDEDVTEPAKQEPATEVITKAEGKSTRYKHTSINWMRGSVGYTLKYNFQVSDLVWSEDGKTVYIRDITSYDAKTYVKGSVEGDKVRVDFPQTIMVQNSDEYVYEYVASLIQLDFKYDEDNQLVFDVKMPEDNYVTYTIDKEAGSVILDLNKDYKMPGDVYTPENMAKYAIAMVQRVVDLDTNEEAFQWYGTGTVTDAYENYSTQGFPIPDGLEQQTWSLVSESSYRPVKVAVDKENSLLYVAGISDAFPSASVVAQLKDGKAIFTTGQYLGYSEYTLSFVYLCGALVDLEKETEEMLAEIVFDCDLEKQELAVNNPKLWMILNPVLDSVYYIDSFVNPKLLGPREEGNLTPKNPSISTYMAYDSAWGFSEVSWNIPYLSVDYNILDTNKLYYMIFVDGEVFDFEPTEYVGLEEKMNYIPFNFSNQNGYPYYPGGEDHWIHFYFDSADTIGIQSFYEASKDNVYKSDYMELDLDNGLLYNRGGGTQVGELLEEGEVVSVYYTDLAGRRVANPECGIYVKSEVLSNGRVRASKVALH